MWRDSDLVLNHLSGGHMNTADMQHMFDYHYWANRQILKASKSLTAEQFAGPGGDSYRSLRRILAHMMNTDGWSRTLCQKHTLEGYVDIEETDFPTLADLAERWAQEEGVMRNYLSGLTENDLNGDVPLLKPGTKRQLWRILWNAVNHATEHRSEVSAILTGFGYSPGELDVAEFWNQVGEE